MTLKQLKAMQEKLEAKIEKSFEEMLEKESEDKVKAYETLLEQSEKLEAQIKEAEALEEKESLDKGGKEPPTDIEETIKAEGRAGRKGFSEKAVQFGKNLVEAVSKGTLFQGVLPRDVAQAIQMKKEDLARVRGVCSVHQATGEYTVYFESDGATVEYVDENATIGETNPDIKPVGLAALKLGAIVKVSREYLTDLGVDVLGFLTNALAKAFADKEDHEILLGAGTSAAKTKIRGIASNTSVAVVTAAAADTVTWEEVKKVIQAIKSYRATATIFCTQELLDIVHSFKDGNTYMFPQGQQITSLMGVPVKVSGAFEALGANAVAMVIGDFAYYHLLDRLSVEVTTLNELYAATDQIGIKAVERIDGDLTIPEAFAVLRMGAGA